MELRIYELDKYAAIVNGKGKVQPYSRFKLNRHQIISIKRHGYAFTTAGYSIIFDIDFKTSEFPTFVNTNINETVNSIKAKLRDNKLNTILNETI